MKLKTIKCSIIEDNQRDSDLLSRLLESYKEIKVVNKSRSVEEGIEFLATNRVDLALMDIEIEGGTSFDILERLVSVDFNIVFVTSFTEFAIQAIKKNALDYILKPVDSDELRNAMKRVLQPSTPFEESLKKQMPKVFIPDSQGFTVVSVNEIVRCSSDNSYTWVHLSDGEKHLCSRSIKYFTDLLEEFSFFRVHNRDLVNFDYILKYSTANGGMVIMKDGTEVLVSRRRKDSLGQWLSSRAIGS